MYINLVKTVSSRIHKGQQRRMAPHTLALWLLLVGCVLSPGGCQHWSYGLSPGGKRELDSLTDTLNNIVESFLHVDTPCSVVGCAKKSTLPKIYRLKGFLDGITDRLNGHKTSKN